MGVLSYSFRQCESRVFVLTSSNYWFIETLDFSDKDKQMQALTQSSLAVLIPVRHSV